MFLMLKVFGNGAMLFCCIVAFYLIDIPCNFMVSMHCVVLIDLIHVFSNGLQ